ncbi:MAG TPA: Wzz/FepE/Etk N-terminal domain-containing protein [Chloroflexota bacterium]|jgi:capsular polysaccharide biosynthesis protein
MADEQAEGTGEAVELRTYLAILDRRKWVIAVTAAATLLVAAIGTLLMPPVYTAATTLRIIAAPNLSGDYVSYDSIMYATRLQNTYAKIATSDGVLDELARRLGLGVRPKVRVEVPANSELMQISVESRDPAQAAQAASALAEILMARAREAPTTAAQSARQALAARLTELEGELREARGADQEPAGASGAALARRSLELKEGRYARLADQYERASLAEAVRPDLMSVLEPASVPEAPTRPRKALNLAVALLLGLVGGVGMAFLVERLDTRLYTAGRTDEVVDLSILGARAGRRRRGAGRRARSDSRRGAASRAQGADQRAEPVDRPGGQQSSRAGPQPPPLPAGGGRA